MFYSLQSISFVLLLLNSFLSTLFLFMHNYFYLCPCLFLCVYGFTLPHGVNIFQAEELLILNEVYCLQIISVFQNLEMSFQFWKIALLDIEFIVVNNIFLWAPWICYPPAIWHLFLRSQLLISKTFLSLTFIIFTRIYLSVNLSAFSFLEFIELPGCVDYVQQIWEVFSHCFFKYCFCSFLSFYFF